MLVEAIALAIALKRQAEDIERQHALSQPAEFEDEPAADGEVEEEGEEATTPATPQPDPDDEEPEKDPDDDEIFKRPEGVPEDWIREESRKGEGIKYVDPNNEHNYVRISRGNPDSSNLGQQQDYVRWQKNGQSLDKNGRVVPSDSLESHIPLKDFKFDLELF